MKKSFLKKEPLSESLSSYRDLKNYIQSNNKIEQMSIVKKNPEKFFAEELNENNKTKILKNIEIKQKILHTVNTEQNCFFDLFSEKNQNNFCIGNKSNKTYKRNFDLTEFKVEKSEEIDIISKKKIIQWIL